MPTPIGRECWNSQPAAPTDTFTQSKGDWATFFWYSFCALPGWIMTALAVSLGAPFWFDLLQSFVNIRNAGAKPNRSDDPRAPGANA